MHQTHNMSYAEYGSSIDYMMNVEKKRQKEFEQSQKIIASLDRQLHK
ncbi:hypothetical protein LF817_15905 [Halobacillus sp. A1]|nr:hypothetical protein [Halobacillus sp. A1]MCP3032810.1 hypothetical protein [Halobacillus sp. A1]